MNEKFNKAKTRELNDRFRTHPLGLGGRVVATQGVMALGNGFLSAAYTAVQKFTDFNEDNDPHGEHDGATFIVNETLCYWKIDYYSTTHEGMGSEAPWDETATNRVLTIMLMEEY